MSSPRPAQPVKTEPKFHRIDFGDIPGWNDDDHASAYRAFLKSCERLKTLATVTTITSTGSGLGRARAGLMPATEAAVAHGPDLSRTQAKAFFEQHFRPHTIAHDLAPGLVTGYFEPELQGSRTRSDDYKIAVHTRPDDLVNLVSESERGTMKKLLTHARKTADGVVPFPTRRQIDSGALDGQDLEILYLADPVDKFFMQVQGSGRVLFSDGTAVRLTYDGKNGLPYTSIGRHLIETGEFTKDSMTLEALGHWLKADPARARLAMWQNESYVFFRELSDQDPDGPTGVDNTTLVPGRSLAVDTSFHALGTPIYVRAPDLSKFKLGDDPNRRGEGFARLMIAQDVGSAITGPERGDIFFGTGDAAGNIAGAINHRAFFTTLLPACSAHPQNSVPA